MTVGWGNDLLQQQNSALLPLGIYATISMEMIWNETVSAIMLLEPMEPNRRFQYWMYRPMQQMRDAGRLCKAFRGEAEKEYPLRA